MLIAITNYGAIRYVTAGWLNDYVLLRSGTQLTAEVLDDQPRLKAIVRAGVGVDNIDVPAATRQGIVVMNTPGGNTVSTAEHTMALMLALSRNVAQGQRQPQGRASGTATSSPAPSSRARRWAIVGLGRVGLAVAKRAQGFDMKVVGFDPFLSAEKALGARHRERLAARRPLGPVRLHHAAHAALGRDPQPDRRRALAKMKPGVRIINCARGGLIDEAAGHAPGRRSRPARPRRSGRPGRS